MQQRLTCWINSLQVFYSWWQWHPSAYTANKAQLDWIEQCFTSPPTQYRLYGRRWKEPKQALVLAVNNLQLKNLAYVLSAPLACIFSTNGMKKDASFKPNAFTIQLVQLHVMIAFNKLKETTWNKSTENNKGQSIPVIRDKSEQLLSFINLVPALTFTVTGISIIKQTRHRYERKRKLMSSPFLDTSKATWVGLS